MKFQLTKSMLGVALAASKDKTRENVNGLHFCHNGGFLRLVATDGHMMAMMDTSESVQEEFEPFTVCAEGVELLRSWLKGRNPSPVTFEDVSTLNESVTASNGVQTATLALVPAEYPNYAQVVPASGRVCELTEPIGLSLEVIEKTIKVLKACELDKGKGYAPCTPISWAFGNGLEPAVLTAHCAGGNLTVIAMPCRLSD